MKESIKKVKKIRLHSEGNDTLFFGLCILIAIDVILWRSFDSRIPFWIFTIVFMTLYAIVVNFFRCPIRRFAQEDTEDIVVAPADGKIVVIEKVFEDEFLHEERIMISIFMSVLNVHANWFPVDGHVKKVKHQNGKFYKAWLPKASKDNERTDVVISTPNGIDILCRQVAGAMARRIVTYAKEGENCFIDEHLGFIKFGSRVDVFLPLDAVICVNMKDKTIGNQTVLAILRSDGK